MRLPSVLNKSVATRTTWFVLAIMTLIMVTAGVIQIRYIRKQVAIETQRQANHSMDGAIKVIDNRIAKVETAVNTAASFAYRFATDKAMADTLLRRLIVANEDIAAATLMYRADYFPKEGRYYAPTISRDPVSGHLEPDEIGGPENDFCYLETDSNWIYTNKLDTGYWCLPYVDSMSTKRAMVSYSVPLHDKSGDVYAILCADVDLKWVKNIVEGAKPYEYSQVFILGRDSQYVCHPDEAWVQTINAVDKVKRSQSNEEKLLIEHMLHWERGIDTMEEIHSLLPYQEPGGPVIMYFAPVERVQWSICFTIPEAKVMEQPNRLRMNMIIMLIIVLVVIAIIMRQIIHSQLLPLKALASSTAEVAKGDFKAVLPKIDTQDEIRELRDSFENMQISLSEYIEQLQETTASKAAIESELHVATDIQMSMLPKEFVPIQGHDDVPIYGQLKPAKAVGGDLFDYYVRDETLFFCIGDVSGKGVPAALVMAVTQAMFRTVSAHESSPANIVMQLNASQTENNDSNMFATLFVGALNLNSGHLRYCNAGHDAPLLIGQGIGLLPCDPNLPIGIIGDWKFSEQEADIYAGTTIFLYTDGLTEAEDVTHQQFGDERIIKVAEQHPATPKQLIDVMTQAVQSFVGEAEQSDDLTMLAIKFKQ